jgi:hypothetical protein
MTDKISYSGDIQELINTITPLFERTWIDYAIQILPSVTTIIIIVVTYQSIARRIRNLKNEKVVEKDIEKLYEASHYLYEYLDMTGLFFSMLNKQAIRVRENRDIEGEHFKGKVQFGSDGLFEAFSKLKKSILIFKTLEADRLVEHIEKIHRFVLKNRKEQLLLIEDYNKNNDFDTISKIVNNYNQLKLTIEIMSQNCIREIISVKKELLND